jgi:site-specific DNA recombinase
MIKRAVLYGRVSGDDRDNDGRNLKGQIEMGRDYSMKRGYQVAAELPEDDRGASGFEINLPKLNQIRAMAQNGEFDVLVVREIDRLSRNLAKQLIVEEELKKYGVNIEYVLGEYPDTPEGNFMKHIRGSVAEFEREKIIERTTRAKRNTVSAGSVLVAQNPPYGYRSSLDNRKFHLVIDEPEARVVRLIYSWYVHDGRSIQKIAKLLTKMGTPTPVESMERPIGNNKKLPPGHWGTTTVGNILKNETYAGFWRYGKTRRDKAKKRIVTTENLITVEVPAIIERHDWNEAQDRRAGNKRLRREPKYEYLLNRRLTCECGYALNACPTYDHDKVYLYYRCSGTMSRNVARRCTVGRFQADVIDKAVWKWLFEFLVNRDVFLESLQAAQSEATGKLSPLQGELDIVNDLIAKNTEQARRLLDAYQNGVYRLEDIAERKRTLDDTHKSLMNRRNELTATISTQAISSEQIDAIMVFSDNQRERVELATQNFAVRKEIIELLDVRAIVQRKENGDIEVKLKWIIGEDSLGTTDDAID